VLREVQADKGLFDQLIGDVVHEWNQLNDLEQQVVREQAL